MQHQGHEFPGDVKCTVYNEWQVCFAVDKSVKDVNVKVTKHIHCRLMNIHWSLVCTKFSSFHRGENRLLLEEPLLFIAAVSSRHRPTNWLPLQVT